MFSRACSRALFTGGLLLAADFSPCLSAGVVPAGKPSSFPNWWFTRDVIKPKPGADSPPAWPQDYLAADDYAAVNLGQLKHMATQAAAELELKFASSGGMGADIRRMIYGKDHPYDTPSGTAWAYSANPDDYTAINAGQLKAVAKLFYDRLAAADPGGNHWAQCPWTPGVSSDDDDYGVINVGQLKRTFNFNPSGGAVRDDFNALDLIRVDDSGSELAELGFTVNFFGVSYDECYVNNNGNITFSSALSTYTPSSLQTAGLPIIAPFWADVDTRSHASGIVRYGTGQVNGRNAFGVTWPNVGYFSEHHDKLNSFQLVLIDRSDVAAGDFDIEFNYSSIQWETGDASSGSNGYGGSVSRSGLSDGATHSLELAYSGQTLAQLDSDPTTGNPNTTSGLIYRSRNSSVPGRFVFQIRGGALVAGLSANAGADQFPPSGQTSCTLAGTVSPTPGNGVTVQWTFDENQAGATISNANTTTPTITLPAPGSAYVRVRLTVTNSNDPSIFSTDTADIYFSN